eukprot:CAMPEP_0179176360 /NCGR_PEP_ID=MMETSP0796-20121207/87195_1 /TAXON_ID=73915 /ORGANISM="Pyrodinium bahamense, Strain pbaha01" /LENGTH=146 /DNA_ID=CAMNT_0020879879 /DNA_START=199 /DNA_END=639 /DNA_ORIENTATION=+
MVCVAFIKKDAAIRHLPGMFEYTLDPVVATLDLTRSEVAPAWSLARSQVFALLDCVAPGEVRVAHHSPNGFDALAVRPGLSVLPEVQAHASKMRYICCQSLARLRVGDVGQVRWLPPIHRGLRQGEVVARDDTLADPRAPPHVSAL